MSQWTLFSNHGHVLLYLATEPDARLRDVAEAVGITERAVQKIVRDLQDGGAIIISKRGRRNRYRINSRKPLRHELEAHRSIGSLVKWMKKEAAPAGRTRSEPAPQPAPEPAPRQPLSTPHPEPVPDVEPLPPVAPDTRRKPPAADQPSEQGGRSPASSQPEQPGKKPAKKRDKKPADDKQKGGDDEQQGSLF